jgi:hypothetical protein
VLSIVSLSLAILVAIGIMVIGCFYIAAPERIIGSFGLKPPAADANTRAWLRLKGIRDVATGVAMLTLMLTTNSRTVGIIVLVFALIPFGDMSNILISDGQKSNCLLRSWGNLRSYGFRRFAADPCLLRDASTKKSTQTSLFTD